MLKTDVREILTGWGIVFCSMGGRGESMNKCLLGYHFSSSYALGVAGQEQKQE